jgi:hypothetical protein
MHARIQPQVADEFLRTGEAGDVADCGEHAGGYDGVDPADRHESPDVGSVQCLLSQALVKHGQLCCEAVEFV